MRKYTQQNIFLTNMKILLLMDPFIPVPPLHYGGIERVIYDIANRYVVMGHEVTIIAGPNSKSPGRLITYGENGDGSASMDYKLLWELNTILRKEIPKHDVLHNFGRLAFLFPVAWTKIRKVQTYMRYITPNNIKLLNKIGVKNTIYTAVSDAIVKTGRPGGGEWKTIYNCAPVDQFDYVPLVSEDAPLVFLGRLERCKGAHTAITVAEITGRKLIIAGNISNLPEEKEYFYKEIQPRIDGKLVQYIGVVDNRQKNELLGKAAAMLLPIEWYEPFPVVLPESFACGTPILAFPGGGVPEGIRPGVTGFLSNSASEMADQVALIPSLSRAACRADALEKYSDTAIAEDYLAIYKLAD
jgi:glycosyltransferase involved in cell wall biosynthesis